MLHIQVSACAHTHIDVYHNLTQRNVNTDKKIGEGTNIKILPVRNISWRDMSTPIDIF